MFVFSLLLFVLPIQNVRILKAHNVSHRLQPLFVPFTFIEGRFVFRSPVNQQNNSDIRKLFFFRFKILTKKLVGIGSQKVSHLLGKKSCLSRKRGKKRRMTENFYVKGCFLLPLTMLFSLII